MTSLTTLKPVVTFMHGTSTNPQGFAEADQRAVRIVASGAHKGTLVVERRKRMCRLHVTAAKAAIVYLGDEAVLTGYESAQEVAPVASLAKLGVTTTPKAKAKAEPKPEVAFLAEVAKPAPKPASKTKSLAKLKAAQEAKAAAKLAASAKAEVDADLEAAKATLREALKGLTASQTADLLTSLVSKS